ncbi:MAG: TfoX/Sxy family protein [Zhongshania sp.]|uniref:TfoX/Sxy family protein n=1 Tax=Zhongshania sp. TaxID=1971902 RepID=UPI0026390DAF|nr:TfoX/Sxy family protein [Zhongshania sp.]MDF1692011.1 TfoX/Sxy family protein [Zhongshania sp.]
MAAKESAFIQFLLEQLQWMGPVTARRMFGGWGLFLEGLMFALVLDNTLYLKADAESRGDFDALGLQPFSYERGGRGIALSYFQPPEEALDDVELLLTWANGAYAAALRSAAAKRRKT